MPSRLQILRSTTAGLRPSTSSRETGELYANFPDKQLGVIDVGKAAMDLLAVRFFSTTATYVGGDVVVQAGQLYRAKGNVAPGLFSASAWDVFTHFGNDGVGSGLDADLLDAQEGAYYLTRANHNGVLPAAAFDDTAHGARGGGTLHPQATAAVAGFMLDAPSDNFSYARRNAIWEPAAVYIEAPNDGSLYGRVSLTWAKAVKLAGDVMTGALTIGPIAGAAQFFLNKPASGQKASILGRTNGLSRWEMAFGDTTAESSGSGSDFSLSRFNDAGTLLDIVLKATRLDGLLTVKGVPTDTLGVATKGYVDGLAAKMLATAATILVSSTWTKPAGCTHIWLEFCGGGGAGGGANATATTITAGGGGGEGGGCGLWVDVRAIASIAITIGAAGAAVGGGSGGNGGQTRLVIDGSNYDGNGGLGGVGGSGVTSGTFSYQGGRGGTTNFIGGGTFGGTAVSTFGQAAQSGPGGGGRFGTGGPIMRQTSGTFNHGSAGSGYGAGGGGGAGYNVAASVIGGGPGTQGMARITPFAFPAS